MMRISLAALVLVTAVRIAGAQAPGAAQVSIDVFLEQRVAEELAVGGTILSRLGVALEIEAVGDRLIVSLVDLATRRAVASTKLDTVPADREAAVAQVTQVAANLVAQLTGNSSSAAAAVKEVLRDERREREAREAAEYRFRQEAITFGDQIGVTTTGRTTTVTSRRVAFQGDVRRRLSAQEFYQTVGRADLAESYSRRYYGGWTALAVGGVVATVGTYVWSSGVLEDACDAPNAMYPECFDDPDPPSAQTKETAGLILTGAGLIGMLVGSWYAWRPHPVSEAEMYDLAGQYNNELRRKHGLPVAGRAPHRRREVLVAPYASIGGGGLTLLGRF